MVRIVFISTLLVCLVCSFGYAQDKGLYFMGRVPQSSYLNPSVKVLDKEECYFGFPLLSALGVSVNSSNFSLNDFIKKRYSSSRDSVVYDYNGLIDRVGTNTNLRADLGWELMAFGFMRQKVAYSFSFAIRSFSNVNIPEHFRSIRGGNIDYESLRPRTVALSGFDVNSYSYYEMAMGASWPDGDNIRYGVRLKLLSGISAIQTRRFDAYIRTSDELTSSFLYSSIAINTSVKGLSSTEDSDGRVKKVNLQGMPLRMPFSQNMGFAVDAGFERKLDAKSTIFGSITDFGLIRWSRDVTRFECNGSYLFNGVDLTPDGNGDVNAKQTIDAVVDTLKNKFKPVSSGFKFSSSLFTKLYLGGTHQLTPWLKAGLLVKMGIYDKIIDPGISASLVFSPSSRFSAVTNISYYNKTLNNLGVGFVFGSKPVQVYVVTDNLLRQFMNAYNGNSEKSGVVIPNHTRSVNIQLGINLFFKSNPKPEPKRLRSESFNPQFEVERRVVPRQFPCFSGKYNPFRLVQKVKNKK